jgi:uncharacterized membrane protein YedE/YeeE
MLLILIAEIIAGLGIGIGLGWALQRGGFCMNTAFRSILFEKDKSLLRSWMLVLTINIPILLAMEYTGFLKPLTAPFFWQALLVGGLLFGSGMVLAGGCASGTCYRAGRGMLGSWGALGGFILGVSLFTTGVFSELTTRLRAERLPFDRLDIANPLELIFIVLVLVAMVLYLIRAPKQKFLIGWGWQKTGIIVGFIAALTWLISGLLDRPFGLSFTQPAGALGSLLISADGSGVSLPMFILIGVFLGANLSAGKEGRWSLPEPKVFVRQSLGGLIMGSGAAIGGGCNIGHGISGIAALSISSLFGVFAIMLGCWAATYLILRIEQQRSA